ncbi:hypothetical protein BG004_005424 [Podila humilis]|nr:hypothetical protein BG004_005424 [Podila humilis]
MDMDNRTHNKKLFQVIKTHCPKSNRLASGASNDTDASQAQRNYASQGNEQSCHYKQGLTNKIYRSKKQVSDGLSHLASTVDFGG